jgi:uncharacterized membrane protein
MASTTVTAPPKLISPSSGASALLRSNRILSVDLMRGIVMIIMALDHTRDYFTWLTFPPEDLTRTYGWLFFTR